MAKDRCILLLELLMKGRSRMDYFTVQASYHFYQAIFIQAIGSLVK